MAVGRFSTRSIDELSTDDRRGYDAAFEQAAIGLSEGGVPVGSALTRADQVVAVGRNRRVQGGDPIAHGEMDALRRAGRQSSYAAMTIFTTLSPCLMCSGAILLFKIPRVVVGEAQTFPGDLDALVDAGCEVVLLDHSPSIELMERFQREYPAVWAEDIAEPS